MYLLHDWGRPGFTAPYALFAWIGDYERGFMVCRYVTVTLAGISALLACAVAHHLKVRHAWVAGILLLAMPLYFRLSYTTLTETICGFYLILGAYFLSRGRFKSAAVSLALAPLARHETIVFLVPVAIYFLLQKRWVAFILLAWAESLWNLLSIKWYWFLPIMRYFQAKPIEHYGEGGGLHYFLLWGYVSTPVLLALTIAGAGWVIWSFVESLMLREEEGDKPGRIRWSRLITMSPRRFTAIYLVMGALGMIVLQTLLYYRNTFASGGYPRFLLPACPWMAALAAITVDWLLNASLTRSSYADGQLDIKAMRFLGVLFAAGLAGVWYASQAKLPEQSEWIIRWLYSGWPGFYLARYIWWLVAACVVFAALPRGATASIVLALSIWWVGNLWWETRNPLFLTAGEQLIKMGIDAARIRAEARGTSLQIHGRSPWVDYYLQRDGRATDPSPDDWWKQSNDGEAKFLLLDNDYTPEGGAREKLYDIPHNKVFSSTLREAFPDADHGLYSVEVLERK